MEFLDKFIIINMMYDMFLANILFNLS